MIPRGGARATRRGGGAARHGQRHDRRRPRRLRTAPAARVVVRDHERCAPHRRPHRRGDDADGRGRAHRVRRRVGHRERCAGRARAPRRPPGRRRTRGSAAGASVDARAPGVRNAFEPHDDADRAAARPGVGGPGAFARGRGRRCVRGRGVPGDDRRGRELAVPSHHHAGAVAARGARPSRSRLARIARVRARDRADRRRRRRRRVVRAAGRAAGALRRGVRDRGGALEGADRSRRSPRSPSPGRRGCPPRSGIRRRGPR